MHAIAESSDGYVTRDRVMELLGRDPSRRLNGFRKPIERAAAHLADLDPTFPADSNDRAVWVDYGGGVTAQGFYVSPAALPALRTAVSNG